MSVTELKEQMHRQIDLLNDENDIEDLSATIDFFFNSREIHFDSNHPDFVAQLENSLENANKQPGISTGELREKRRF
ncbi:hypothetical protein GCM10028803_30000 [Larkinella knui]|uniref:Uncharacterized protein n=1 Tax=Larkinella knui TaxID=2025310 RepID=A0A3P1CXS8_9BACT|nr:hypothetical protein [Larkinella knui]RRB18029.1 hypothetical protein EHT87_07080 [Larkinella knui]